MHAIPYMSDFVKKFSSREGFVRLYFSREAFVYMYINSYTCICICIYA